MYKKIILMFLIAAMLVPGVMGFSLVKGFFTYVVDDKLLVMHVDVKNPTDSKLRDVKVNAFSEDLGVRMYSTAFDLGSGDRVTKRLYGDVENVEQEYTLMRVQSTVGGKKFDTDYIEVPLN